LYGSRVTDAQEVIPLRAATRIPGAPPFVRGLINMRGTIVTVLDLGVRFDSSRPLMDEGSILLVRHGSSDRRVGIAVDEVMEVRELAIDDGETATAGARSTVARGVATLEDSTVVILDLDALISQVLLS
jgi:purine-binding chemotaxis protein CheW